MTITASHQSDAPGHLQGARVIVREASSGDARAWDAYVASNPEGSFYHRFGWRQIVLSCLAHEPLYLIAWQADRIVGVLPLIAVNTRLFGRILCSMPYLNYGGPCADSTDIAALLMKEAVRQSEELGVDYLEIRCATRQDIAMQVALHKVSLTIALEMNPEALWDQFTTKHRNNIRRAQKKGLEVRSGGQNILDEFYAVLERSWRDLGTPLYQRGYFEAILDTFPDDTRIFLCTYHRQPVSVAFNGFHNGTVEGMWQGALPIVRTLQANYVLYWEMVRDSCMRGGRLFHLGRSTADSGSEQFKKRWNAHSQQLYWYFHRPDGGPMPDLSVDNPKYRVAIAAWRHLPLPIVRFLGPHLARGIP